ncbi:MAG: methyltransferase [Deltaproteobacteria bacterium]|nr:methyltransferase [Deltaproteobacteria bacterium]MBW1948552.1 methyltransferase [Deltaproteobacteria bacterium]MBW2006980.1 methyltransferase [Deltaproteobacteria bacterium]
MNHDLSLHLRKVLPDARLAAVTLALPPPIRLMLLDGRNMNRAYSWEEIERIMAHPPHWAFCWAGGRALAARLLEAPYLVRGKTVLDFGCGSGVVGIAAALSGAGQVIACDRDPVALKAVLYNAGLNGVTLLTRGDLDEIHGAVDLVLAADILYDRDNLPLLDRFLKLAPEVLVADSRVKDLCWPRYALEAEVVLRTLPDLGEPEEHRRVMIYRGRKNHTGRNGT